jgi:SPP1 gp7 family putative phage head morphogenesis protein
MKDATRTLTLRNKATADAAARFSRVAKAVTDALSLGDYTGVKLFDPIIANARKEPTGKAPKDGSRGRISRRRAKMGLQLPILTPEASSPALSRRYVFQRDAANLEMFDLWIQEVINNEILQPTIPLEQKWLQTDLGVAYSRGANSSGNKIASALQRTGLELPDNSPFSHPAHLDRGKLIYARSFNSLEGITTSMKAEMRTALANGIIKGKNPKAIARDINARINVGAARAKRLARTEIIEAHQEASIQEAEIAESESGYAIDMEWVTTKDGRERETHKHRDGKIYTKEQARALIGEPNCRCAVVPYIRMK